MELKSYCNESVCFGAVGGAKALLQGESVCYGKVDGVESVSFGAAGVRLLRRPYGCYYVAGGLPFPMGIEGAGVSVSGDKKG